MFGSLVDVAPPRGHLYDVRGPVDEPRVTVLRRSSLRCSRVATLSSRGSRTRTEQLVPLTGVEPARQRSGTPVSGVRVCQIHHSGILLVGTLVRFSESLDTLIKTVGIEPTHPASEAGAIPLG